MCYNLPSGGIISTEYCSPFQKQGQNIGRRRRAGLRVGAGTVGTKHSGSNNNSRETSVRNDDQHPFPCEERKRVYIYEREVGRLLGSEWNLSALLLPPIVATSLLLLGVFAALLRLLSFSSSTTTSAVPDINCVCSYCLLRPADEGKYVKRIRSVPKTKKGRQRRTGTALAEKEKLKRLAGNLQCGGNENRLQGTEGMKDVGRPVASMLMGH